MEDDPRADVHDGPKADWAYEFDVVSLRHDDGAARMTGSAGEGRLSHHVKRIRAVERPVMIGVLRKNNLQKAGLALRCRDRLHVQPGMSGWLFKFALSAYADGHKALKTRSFAKRYSAFANLAK